MTLDAAFPADARPEGVIRILLVENDEGDAARSAAALGDAFGPRLALLHAGTLAQAIRLLMEGPVDVVLVELDLPDATGLATLAGIRGAAPGVPVVLYARSLDEALAVRALRVGAQECLPKAHTPVEEVPRLLRFAMERQRHLAALDAARMQAAHRATHDPLTGLANRGLFLDHLDRALAFGARYGRKTGLLFVDLDGFKIINDSLGHAAGDRLLVEVARRLLGTVRRSDAVARLGGDEFVVLLPDVNSRLDVAHVREMILRCLEDPIDLGDGRSERVAASVGGAMSPLDGATAQELLDAADVAMYREKYSRRRGRMPTPVFGLRVQDETIAHQREMRLRGALEAGELAVHYQPQVDVVSQRVVGLEALLRWHDPDQGMVAPSSFLPLAEDTGLIVPIGDLVLREACAAAVAWRREHGDTTMRVGVNLSAVQLREKAFEERVQRILEETGCPPDALVLELTESSTLYESDHTLDSLRAVRALGVRLFVDDFGVGFDSLAFLRDAPLDGFKIDRRFVSRMLTDERDRAIVSALVTLARGLHLHVIAEGVETVEQSERLRALLCTEQQGHHFAPALPLAALTPVVRSQRLGLGAAGAPASAPRSTSILA
ncbi:MAG TPA: EAL domain-containing protein [Gemmatimonadaceae bacterium]|nr:EAL domain-containing protein [Gemmatimonadaceae bacterium]